MLAANPMGRGPFFPMFSSKYPGSIELSLSPAVSPILDSFVTSVKAPQWRKNFVHPLSVLLREAAEDV
jgi:hypothetical protein